MNICIFHSRLGHDLSVEMQARLPAGDAVRVVVDTGRDPPDAENIEVLIANTFPAGLLSRCPRLRWLQLTGTGYDHVLAEQPPADLLIANAGDIPARAVSEFVWMGLLGLAKCAPTLVRQQDAGVWKLPDARLVAGTTLVIAGLGNIGRAVAQRASGFEVRTVGITRSGLPHGVTDEVHAWDDIKRILHRADHLVVALPGGPATQCLFSAELISALPSHATLINVSRGSIVDASAVIAALHEGRLRAALLDVHDAEPLPPQHPAWRTDNLWVTPHGAFCYPGEARDLAELIAENIERYKGGRPLKNRVFPAPRASAGHGPA